MPPPPPPPQLALAAAAPALPKPRGGRFLPGTPRPLSSEREGSPRASGFKRTASGAAKRVSPAVHFAPAPASPDLGLLLLLEAMEAASATHPATTEEDATTLMACDDAAPTPAMEELDLGESSAQRYSTLAALLRQPDPEVLAAYEQFSSDSEDEAIPGLKTRNLKSDRRERQLREEEARALAAQHAARLAAIASARQVGPSRGTRRGGSQQPLTRPSSLGVSPALGPLAAPESPRKKRKGRTELQGPCCHCHTHTSPQWRKGPACKPTLCNACGTRFLRTKSLGKATDKAALAPAALGAEEAGPRCPFCFQFGCADVRIRLSGAPSLATTVSNTPVLAPQPHPTATTSSSEGALLPPAALEHAALRPMPGPAETPATAAAPAPASSLEMECLELQVEGEGSESSLELPGPALALPALALGASPVTPPTIHVHPLLLQAGAVLMPGASALAAAEHLPLGAFVPLLPLPPSVEPRNGYTRTQLEMLRGQILKCYT